ncbi:MAG TPA: hypothetical protein VGG83_06275, partial [Trebonia sp.]
MATCPSGHASASDDFCDVCGVLIGAAPSLASAGAPAGGGGAGTTIAASPAPGEACPRCGAPRAGQFCESCGYDFTVASSNTFDPALYRSSPPLTIPPAPA